MTGMDGSGDTALFRVGTAIADITPPLSVPYLSFEPRHRPFAGVHDALSVRVAVIGAGGNDVAIISADLIGFADTLLGPGRSFTGEVRKAVAARTGIRPENIMLAAVHCHASPDTLNFRPLREAPHAQEWLEDLIQLFAECADAAMRNRFDARLYTASDHLPGLSLNRRGEANVADELSLLLFQSLDARRTVALVHWACHPVIVQNQPLVSGDYAGMVTTLLEGAPSSFERCLFLQGTCGDLNPICGDKGDFTQVRTMAMAVGGKCMELYGRVSLGAASPEPAVVRCVSERLELASRELPECDATHQSTHETEEFAARRAEGTGPYEAEIQVIRLGNNVVLGVSAELFSAFGAGLQAAVKSRRPLATGYANGYIGYVVPPDSWKHGGYETAPGMWSKVGPTAHQLLLESAVRLAERCG